MAAYLGNYKVIMVSDGGIKHDFVNGLTQNEAFEICEMNNWEYQDENGYCWELNFVRES